MAANNIVYLIGTIKHIDYRIKEKKDKADQPYAWLSVMTIGAKRMNGTRKSNDFHSCFIWNEGLVNYAKEHLNVGGRIAINGELRGINRMGKIFTGVDVLSFISLEEPETHETIDEVKSWESIIED